MNVGEKLQGSCAPRVRGSLGCVLPAPFAVLAQSAETVEVVDVSVTVAVAMYGLQVGLERERHSVRLFGENLSNERRMSGLAVENLAFGTDGNFYGPLDAPRIVGRDGSKILMLKPAGIC